MVKPIENEQGQYRTTAACKSSGPVQKPPPVPKVVGFTEPKSTIWSGPNKTDKNGNK